MTCYIAFSPGVDSMNDAKNIAGIGQLLVDNGDDLEEITMLEREIIDGAPTEEADINAAMEYGKEMENLSKSFERLSQGDETRRQAEDSMIQTPRGVTAYEHTQDHNDILDDFTRPITPANMRSFGGNKTSVSDSPKNNMYTAQRSQRSPPSGSQRSPSSGSHAQSYHSQPYQSKPSMSSPPRSQSQPSWAPKDSHLQKLTLEEQRQMHVNKVLAFAEDKETEFDIDKERDENEKMSLLEQIDMLKSTLSDDGVDIDNVPSVGRSNSLKEIDDVYRILRLKNDRSRCCSLANELILIGAGGLESAFDGEKEWFGYTPDLTGWSETVKIKLRRMRYETSTLVQDVMQGYQMGPGWRLLLEIIPSLFLYSRNRRLSANSNLVDDYKFRLERESQQAMSELNSIPRK